VKPVVTEPTECVPLERHAIINDRCIRNNIGCWFWSHHSLVHVRPLMRNTTISCLPPTGMCFLGVEGVTRSACGGDIDKEHLFLLFKASGSVACKKSS